LLEVDSVNGLAAGSSPEESRIVGSPERRKRPPQKTQRRSSWVLLCGIAISILLSFLSILKPTVFGFLNHRVYDSLLESNRTGEPSRILLIVDIDEESLKQFGQWPWPRHRVARLVDKLRDLGALSIGLDMLFAERDRTSIDSIKEEFYDRFGFHPEFPGLPTEFTNNDRILADALSKGSVVLGYQFLFDERVNSDGCLLHPLRVHTLGTAGVPRLSGLFLRAVNASCNLRLLSEAASASGFFNVSPDRDGILRSIPLIIEHKEEFYPSLAIATLLRALNQDLVTAQTSTTGVESLFLGNTVIPLSPIGNMLIRFRGAGGTFRSVSAVDILSDRVSRQEVEGKIIFIGTSAAGMRELISTPLDPSFPGVEIHATVVDNILKGDFLSRPDWVPGVEFLLVFATGTLSALVLAWTRVGWSSLLLGVVAICLWQLSAWTFRGMGVFISPILPLLTLGGNLSVLTLLKFWREEQKTRERARELAMAQEATIESMCCLTETRDPETGWHIKRTQNYLRVLAEHLKNHPRFTVALDDASIDLLCKSAALHDIGKVGVPDRILLKPGKLTEEEFEEMKKHTLYGRDAILFTEKKLGNASFLHFAREIAYTHHEKWDGCGYPEGLRADAIPVSGRLMALVDTYDALVNKRVYKSPVPHEEAVQIILGERGSQFDPDVVDAFSKVEKQFCRIAVTYADTLAGGAESNAAHHPDGP
jgi:adenylate cyclase